MQNKTKMQYLTNNRHTQNDLMFKKLTEAKLKLIITNASVNLKPTNAQLKLISTKPFMPAFACANVADTTFRTFFQKLHLYLTVSLLRPVYRLGSRHFGSAENLIKKEIIFCHIAENG